MDECQHLRTTPKYVRKKYTIATSRAKLPDSWVAIEKPSGGSIGSSQRTVAYRTESFDGLNVQPLNDGLENATATGISFRDLNLCHSAGGGFDCEVPSSVPARSQLREEDAIAQFHSTGTSGGVPVSAATSGPANGARQTGHERVSSFVSQRAMQIA